MVAKKDVNVKANKSEDAEDKGASNVTVTANKKGDSDDVNVESNDQDQFDNNPQGVNDADFEDRVQSNKEASNPFEVSNADPTDPNGYNNAPHAAKGFIVNPVAGGGAPVDTGEFDVVNGITQFEGDDLPESNVDPEGVIEKLRKDANSALVKQKKNSK